MFGQTFAPTDLPVIGTLILLEGLLSADNALVLAILVRHLPEKQQKKALVYGLGGAFVFRLAAILLANFIIRLWWLQALGALYLLWICLKHWLPSKAESESKAAGGSFWKTVVIVELTDIAFAVDSIVAAVAMINSTDKIWVVYLGAMIGIILLRIAAGFFIKLLDKWPGLEHLAYALIAWVAVKLLFMSGHNFEASSPGALPFHIGEMSPAVFWIGMGLIASVGTIWAVVRGRSDEE